MRIGISTRGLNQGSYAISTIVLHLTRAIIELASGNHEIFLYTNDPEFEHLFDASARKRSLKMSNRFVWDQIWLPYAAKKDKIDIALFMKGTMPLLLPCKGAAIFHDLGYFDSVLRPYKFLDTIYMKKMMALSGQKAAKVFADSEYTKREAINILGLDEKKITVCYPSCSPIFNASLDIESFDVIKAQYTLPSNYIFSPISFSPRKNFDRILQAFNRVKNQIPHDLVITGGQSWGMGNLLKKMGHELKKRVRILGTVRQNHMPAIFRLASFTLYPSLLEGFGIPILEAFHSGCPVLTSNITSMPEVAGDAAYLVNPYDIEQISEGILRLSKDKILRQELIKKGFERARQFTWERTAQTILENLLN